MGRFFGSAKQIGLRFGDNALLQGLINQIVRRSPSQCPLPLGPCDLIDCRGRFMPQPECAPQSTAACGVLRSMMDARGQPVVLLGEVLQRRGRSRIEAAARSR